MNGEASLLVSSLRPQVLRLVPSGLQLFGKRLFGLCQEGLLTNTWAPGMGTACVTAKSLGGWGSQIRETPEGGGGGPLLHWEWAGGGASYQAGGKATGGFQSTGRRPWACWHACILIGNHVKISFQAMCGGSCL